MIRSPEGEGECCGWYGSGSWVVDGLRRQDREVDFGFFGGRIFGRVPYGFPRGLFSFLAFSECTDKSKNKYLACRTEDALLLIVYYYQ